MEIFLYLKQNSKREMVLENEISLPFVFVFK